MARPSRTSFASRATHGCPNPTGVKPGRAFRSARPPAFAGRRGRSAWRALLSLLLVILLRPTLLAAEPVGPADEAWLLVRGKADAVGALTHERIGQAYLGHASWTLVGADGAAAAPAASRFVVGTADDNPAVAAILRQLGAAPPEDGRFLGRRLESGTGLLLVGDDPDGGGRLVLATGADADGVLACFGVRLDMSADGLRWVRSQRDVEPGPILFDNLLPTIVRLDRDVAPLVGELSEADPEIGRRRAAALARAGTSATPGPTLLADRALHMARLLEGHRFVVEASAHPGVDLLGWSSELLSLHGAALARARSFADAHDLDQLIAVAHETCARELAPWNGPAPVYFVLLGAPHGTNARSFDHDTVTGRPRVLLNLTMLADEGAFETAALHETIHTRQQLGGKRLLDRAVHEGVATRLSQLLRPGTPDHQALMWTEDELARARAHHDAILDAFRDAAASTDPGVHTPFVVLGRRHVAFPAAPSRTGYYVGWLAARAWTDAHPDASPRDLLDASTDEIFAALP